MCLVERHPHPASSDPERAIKADASARFVHDLVTGSIPMSFAAVKAASDAIDGAVAVRHRKATSLRKAAGRAALHLVSVGSPRTRPV